MSGSGGFWWVGAEGAGSREAGLELGLGELLVGFGILLLGARWKISVSDRDW